MKKLKTAVKSKTRTLRLNISENEFKKTWWKWSASWIITDNKTKNEAFNNNMLTDIKLSKAQISKIIWSGGFLGSLLSKLAGALMMAKNILAR